MKRKLCFNWRRTVEHVAGAIIGIIASISWGEFASLEFRFQNYPKAPEAISGKLIPYLVKGMTVFITTDEFERVSLAHRVFGFSLFSGVCLAIILRVFRTKKDKPIDL